MTRTLPKTPICEPFIDLPQLLLKAIPTLVELACTPYPDS